MCMHFPLCEYLWQLKEKSILGISPKNFSLDIQLYFYFYLSWKIRYFLMQMLCCGIFVSSSSTFYRKEFLKKLLVCPVKICVQCIYAEIFNIFSVLWFTQTNNPLLKIWSCEYCLKVKKHFIFGIVLRKSSQKSLVITDFLSLLFTCGV